MGCYAAKSNPKLFHGIVLSSPLIKLDDSKLNFVNKVVGPFLSALAPKLLFPESIPIEFISRNKKAVEEYLADPMIQKGWIRVRTGSDMLVATEQLQDTCSQLTTPFIAFHGDKDGIVDIRGTEILMAKSGSHDKTFIRCPGMYHEIYEDEEHYKVIYPRMIQWLDEHHTEPVENIAGTGYTPPGPEQINVTIVN